MGLKPRISKKGTVRIWPTEFQGMKEGSLPLINTSCVLLNATLQPSLQLSIQPPFLPEPGCQQPTMSPSPQQRSQSGSSHPSSYRPINHTETSSPRCSLAIMPPSQPGEIVMKSMTPISFMPTSYGPVQVPSSPAPSMTFSTSQPLPTSTS